MPEQDRMFFIIIIIIVVVVLSKRQNKREQKLKLLRLNGASFNSKGKRFISKAWVFAMPSLVRVHENNRERKQRLKWKKWATHMLQDLHWIPTCVWLLQTLRYKAEQ